MIKVSAKWYDNRLKYKVYFNRIMLPVFNRDIEALRSYNYDIRSILLENSTREVAEEIDENFLQRVDNILGGSTLDR